MKINEKLKFIRTIQKLSQSEMALLLKIHIRSIQRFERGEQEPRYVVLKQLCNYFPQYALWLMTDGIDVGVVENKTL